MCCYTSYLLYARCVCYGFPTEIARRDIRTEAAANHCCRHRMLWFSCFHSSLRLIYIYPLKKKGKREEKTRQKKFIHLSNQPAKTIGIFPLSSALCFSNRTRPRFEMSANLNARKSFAILVFHALNRYHDIQLQQWEEEES